MPSLKDLKLRIDSVKSTRKITKAMQMVAAAKLRRAQEAAENARPYAERMDAVMGGLAASVAGLDSAPKLLRGSGADETHLLVVMTSERGLCGGFNSAIVREARRHIEARRGAGKTVRILTIGSKGRDQLKRDFADLFVGHVDLSGVRRIGYDTALGIATGLIAEFEAGDFDVATIFYSTFKSVISQLPTPKQIIPATFDADGAEAVSGYSFEPGEPEILADLLPRAVATQIFTALLENAASEQGARMTAMDNATRNAGELIDKLTIQYNRTRQAVITSELIEIISGAEAL
ncbi:MAG TPA: F0F1 ATP synthase subunit gamma [Rhodobacteraceae bacterium]|jgi:F-type H+-transporting ATPase subunit gamma|nr:F0F1 ATP synthase subunit gamma [Paracoccaceae bacterium]HBG97710.1 F0F1 ATP synthase subunit gamma [Paracoccaceae bacterium]